MIYQPKQPNLLRLHWKKMNMENFEKYLISEKSSIREALIRLDKLAQDATVFVVDANNALIGAVTDGDIRRGLIESKKILH